MPSVRSFGYKIEIKFINIPLVIDKNNYAVKILNANIVKNSDKSKYIYGGYEILFDGAGTWSFVNDFAKNVVIFGIDNSSSSHTDNRKNNFRVPGKGPPDDIDDIVGAGGNKYAINLTKAKTKFFLSLHCNDDSSYLLVNGKESNKFKANNKNSFLLNFVYETYLKNLAMPNQRSIV